MAEAVVLDKDGVKSTTAMTNGEGEQGFQLQLDEILRTFYASAFTLLVYRRGLCPKDGFTTKKKLGIQVPWFIHPSCIEYVTEVSKTIVTFMKRNILEGAVLHVVIEKDKKPLDIQRFVFRPNGGFVLADFEGLDLHRSMEELESVKTRCASCLLQIRQYEIQEITCPWFSRWSISLGVKKQFLAMCREIGPNQLFTHCPNNSFFPWKKRERRGRKSEVSNLTLKSQNLRKNLLSLCTPISKKKKDGKEKMETMNRGSPDIFANEDDEPVVGTTESDESKNTSVVDDVQSFSSSSFIGDEIDFLTSSEEDGDVDSPCADGAAERSLNPITSFQIIEGLMMNVYSIDYPCNPSYYETLSTASKRQEIKLFQSLLADDD